MIVKMADGRWAVYSEGKPRRRLGGPYPSRARAAKRLAQVEYWKATRGDAAPRARLDADDRELQIARERVAREFALHKRFGGKTRKGRIPRQNHPKPLEVEYAKALVELMRRARDVYAPLLMALKASRSDADDTPKKKLLTSDNAKKLLDQAEQNLQSAVSTTQIDNLASKFAARTSTYQRVQLGRQVKAALGADPYVRDPVMAGVSRDFVAQNVSLISRIPKRLHEKIEGLVMNAVAKPELNKDLAAQIEAQFGVSERHARLIARDQITKYHGAVNKARQESLGVKAFIWRTVNDERVRDSHADLDGIQFDWDDLPTNEDDEEIFPGSEIQCRCSAEPVLDDLLDAVDDADEQLDEPDIDTTDELPDDEDIADEIDTDPEQDL